MLQAAVQAEFAECDADKRPFAAHLSVGQAQGDGGAKHLAHEIKKSVSEFLTDRKEEEAVALDWYVDKIFVIERKGYHDRFEVVGSIELGNE
jgi:hypothetical protein